MIPNDDLHFSRSGTSHFGKLTTEVKTRLSEDEKSDLMRASHIVGMSESEFVREIIRIRLYGLEHVQRMLLRAWRLWPERGRGRGRKGMGRNGDVCVLTADKQSPAVIGAGTPRRGSSEWGNYGRERTKSARDCCAPAQRHGLDSRGPHRACQEPNAVP